MNPKRKRRLVSIGLLMTGLGVSVGLVLLALQENVNLFFSPSQVAAAPEDRRFRIGGLVVPGSVEKTEGKLAVAFRLSDTAEEVRVEYEGILPDLFGEGQGIVAEGRLDRRGVFIADRVLAKHDENYMPPEVEQALKMSGEWQGK